jgi:SAM-dependent methyltransferase
MGSDKDIYRDEPLVRCALWFGYSINKDGIGDLCKELGFNDNKLKLEIASGTRPHRGYIHLEYSVKKPQVHVKADARMIPFGDCIFDEVLSVHFLEHLYWATIPIALAEMNRVLKPGGILLIEVPDYDVAKNRPLHLTHLMFETIYMNNTGDGDTGEHDEFVYGFNHSSCFNYDILKAYLECSGFLVIRDIDMENRSCHNWIGVLTIRATKVTNPMPLTVLQDRLGRGITPPNKWNRMYSKRYG